VIKFLKNLLRPESHTHVGKITVAYPKRLPATMVCNHRRWNGEICGSRMVFVSEALGYSCLDEGCPMHIDLGVGEVV